MLGLNVIKEAVFEGGKTDVKSKKLDFKTTFMIGVATNIDALFSGSMIYLTSTPLIVASSIIGAGSFLLGIIGFNLNCYLKKNTGKISPDIRRHHTHRAWRKKPDFSLIIVGKTAFAAKLSYFCSPAE